MGEYVVFLFAAAAIFIFVMIVSFLNVTKDVHPIEYW